MKKKKPDNSHVREWTHSLATTVKRQGQEARSGYAPPRRKWDTQTESERQQRAAEKLSR